MPAEADDPNQLPKTPEEWVAWEEKRRSWTMDDPSGEALWARPEYDNWQLWVIYHVRKNWYRHARKGRLRRYTLAVGQHLPAFVRSTGTVDKRGLAAAACCSHFQVRKTLSLLTDLGADFSRLGHWPHPLKEQTTPEETREPR